MHGNKARLRKLALSKFDKQISTHCVAESNARNICLEHHLFARNFALQNIAFVVIESTNAVILMG